MADINILDTNRYIVYAPNRDFLGMDTFSYTIRLGVLESKTTGVVTLDTRVCRQNFCLNEAFSVKNWNHYYRLHVLLDKQNC